MRFANRRNIFGSWKSLESREAAAGVLDDDPFVVGTSGGLVEEERSLVVRVLGTSESIVR